MSKICRQDAWGHRELLKSSAFFVGLNMEGHGTHETFSSHLAKRLFDVPPPTEPKRLFGRLHGQIRDIGNNS